MKTIKLANPRGFCAGVDRAIDIVERAIDKFGPPVYVKHEVVHNKLVVNDLKNKGAIFVEDINEIPDGHGGSCTSSTAGWHHVFAESFHLADEIRTNNWCPMRLAISSLSSSGIRPRTS